MKTTLDQDCFLTSQCQMSPHFTANRPMSKEAMVELSNFRETSDSIFKPSERQVYLRKCQVARQSQRKVDSSSGFLRCSFCRGGSTVWSACYSLSSITCCFCKSHVFSSPKPPASGSFCLLGPPPEQQFILSS